MPAIVTVAFTCDSPMLTSTPVTRVLREPPMMQSSSILWKVALMFVVLTDIGYNVGMKQNKPRSNRRYPLIGKYMRVRLLTRKPDEPLAHPSKPPPHPDQHGADQQASTDEHKTL